MMRIGLLLGTNFAVLIVAGIIMSLLGLDDMTQMNLWGMLLFCALFGFGGALISLFLSKMMAKKSSGTQLIETPANDTEKWLYDTVARLAEKAGIGMPEVGIFPSQQPNAFATGWNKNKSLVAVSAGLLNNFKRDEVEAVMAHEIGHVANGDMVTLTLIQGIMNTFVLFFARLVGMVVAGAARNKAMGRLGLFRGRMDCPDRIWHSGGHSCDVVFTPPGIQGRRGRCFPDNAGCHGCGAGTPKAADRPARRG